jgi:hypothetical protein
LFPNTELYYHRLEALEALKGSKHVVTDETEVSLLSEGDKKV